MDITSWSREKITEGLERAKKKNEEAVNENIRLIFSPLEINDSNFERVCDIYSRIDPGQYETVVLVETYDRDLDKRLPMPSNKYFETPLGTVPVNDYMRNEFCDEDDDFYIHDEGFSREMSLFHQLMMLQCTFNEFSVVSIQIADQGPAIVKELAFVLEEVLASRDALVVFCCELEQTRKVEFAHIRDMITKDNRSGLLNYLNSGDSHMQGASTFIAGILVSHAWNLDLYFLNGKQEGSDGSLVTGYADRPYQFFRP